MARKAAFIQDVGRSVTTLLQFVDSLDSLRQEYSTFGTNNVQITDADVQAVFGSDVTSAEFTTALGAINDLITYVRTPATAAKLYNIKL